MPATVPIPPKFLDRMSGFLGDEFPAFAAALEGEPVSGLRVNTLKLSPEQFGKLSRFALEARVDWCESAFHLPASETNAGLHPHHFAGLYYLQDPSAMAPAELLAPQPGERVLDLAAAPGGKATQLASLMRGEGLLVANEIKTKRAGHLVQNIERWGAGNVVITNETPEALADHFGAFFDRVLVDAPCSGEGMFRKDMGARKDWSVEMVEGCALRQSAILRLAAKLVRPGGSLLYSTCTFAPEEDERVISEFLDAQTGQGDPKFEVVALHPFGGIMPGRPDWINDESHAEGLRRAARLFPHRLRGEGHYICLLRKVKTSTENWTLGTDRLARPTRTQLGFWRRFAGETLAMSLPDERIRLVRDRLYLIREETPDLGRLRVVHPGVWLGTLKKDRFEPAHPLALYLGKGQAQNLVDLPANDHRLRGYLRGQPFEAEGEPGWTVIAVDGFPLGWGKRVQGVVKNHYPRGWMSG